MMNDSLFLMPKNIQTRWASPENWDGAKGAAGQANQGRKGSACFPLKAGEQKILAHAENTSGTIRRIWMTINDRSPRMLRGLRLDMTWDGADRPAVSAPLGDFFGQGLGRCVAFQSALFSNPEGRSFNCCVPMPFRTGMKIVRLRCQACLSASLTPSVPPGPTPWRLRCQACLSASLTPSVPLGPTPWHQTSQTCRTCRADQ